MTAGRGLLQPELDVSGPSWIVAWRPQCQGEKDGGVPLSSAHSRACGSPRVRASEAPSQTSCAIKGCLRQKSPATGQCDEASSGSLVSRPLLPNKVQDVRRECQEAGQLGQQGLEAALCLWTNRKPHSLLAAQVQRATASLLLRHIPWGRGVTALRPHLLICKWRDC